MQIIALEQLDNFISNYGMFYGNDLKKQLIK